jgi:hypothetical protein
LLLNRDGQASSPGTFVFVDQQMGGFVCRGLLFGEHEGGLEKWVWFDCASRKLFPEG